MCQKKAKPKDNRSIPQAEAQRRNQYADRKGLSAMKKSMKAQDLKDGTNRSLGRKENVKSHKNAGKTDGNPCHARRVTFSLFNSDCQ